jgi:hypothetical protein
MVISQPFPHLVASEAPDKYVEPLQEPLHTQVEAMAVQQGNQSLVNFLNAWIAAKKAEGYIEKTYAYWFLSTDWLSRVAATEDDKADKAEGDKAEDEKVLVITDSVDPAPRRSWSPKPADFPASCQRKICR